VRSSRLVLSVLLLSFFALACFYVPRLTNCLWSDNEFTGWVSPIAHRIAGGERIYRDFTLPIPPASFLVMAGVQKLTGRFLLLDELWLCAVSNLLMTAISYLFVRRFTHARNAVMAAALTAPVIILTPKEIAYDQTAQVVAWGTVALLATGLTSKPGRARTWWLRAAGFGAGLTMVFKSSTGTGAVLGIGLAVVVMTFVAWRCGRMAAVRARIPDIASLAAGVLAGAAATVLVVILAGGSVGEFYRVVFVDGPKLKGGQLRMVLNLLSYTLFQTPVHMSFVIVCFLAWIFLRVAGDKTALLVQEKIDPEPEDLKTRDGIWFAGGVSLMIVAVVAVAIGLLTSGVAMIPTVLRTVAGAATVGPGIGLLLLAMLLVNNLMASQQATDQRAAFASTVLCAGAISLMHNLSHPQHRPFYDNNPVIPLAFASLLMLMDRAAPRLKYVLFGLTLLGLFGDKFQRFLDARHPVDDPSFWNGLRVSDNGLEVLRAAVRARELAGPDGTVLMLPEDPATMALIGRPRPKLAGAIVFVDQYPQRLLKRDQAVLNSLPPDVLVLHPNDQLWNRVYRIWTLKSAAATLQNEFVEQYRHTLYRSDSTYPTWFFNTPSTMEVLVRTRE
jgi:hypothetical protein